jgi:hypothetical protein
LWVPLEFVLTGAISLFYGVAIDTNLTCHCRCEDCVYVCALRLSHLEGRSRFSILEPPAPDPPTCVIVGKATVRCPTIPPIFFAQPRVQFVVLHMLRG